MITERIFDAKYPKIKEYTLQSDSICVKVLNLGVTITSIVYNASQEDVVLGYDHLEDYLRFENYFGACIGRCANRIRGGTFTLNNHEYHVDINDGLNSLHGGTTGFHSRIFDVQKKEDTLVFHYVSKDMEEGYPGLLNVYIHMELQDSKLILRYEACSSADTIVNFTNHSYFALQGEGKGSVEHQIMKTQASLYAENDENRLATGNLLAVENSPFDFRNGKEIGKDIEKKENLQIRCANGYDHYLRYQGDVAHIVTITDTKTNHQLIVESDMPGFHFYVPDYQEGHKGKKGKVYTGHCALCLETSFLPDAIHSQKHPETILKKDQLFLSETSYTFL